MTTLEELAQAIELGHPNETEELVRKALEEGTDPVELVEEVMVPAMRVVGEKYKEQQVDIPGILSSARSVQKGFEAVKEVKADYQTKEHGTIILGTIEGDLHDVGKNLVAMMFRGAGFKVIDLGVDISEKQFLRAVKENPDVSIVCISSLLSTTNKEMKQVVKALRKKAAKESEPNLQDSGRRRCSNQRTCGKDWCRRLYRQLRRCSRNGKKIYIIVVPGRKR